MRHVSLRKVAPPKAAELDLPPNKNVWCLGLEHVESQTGRIVGYHEDRVDKAGSSTYTFDEGNVLYSKLRPYLNKVVCPGRSGIATTELVPLRPNPKELDRKYLTYYLRSPRFVGWISGQVNGAKMPRVNMKAFWNHEIPLPPLTEQKRIAAILDKADAIRRKRAQALQLTDQFLQSVFLDMFGDPVTNPKGWEMGILDDYVLGTVGGKSVGGEYRERKPEEWAVLKISAVTTGRFKDTEYKVVASPPEPSTLVTPKRGDLLFSRANTRELVAATCLVPDDYPRLFLPDKLWRIDTAPGLQKEYLKFVLTHQRVRDLLTGRATGTSGSMLNISKPKLLQLSIPIPDIEMQLKFGKMYWDVISMSTTLSHAQKASGHFFDSLVQRAFRGEL